MPLRLLALKPPLGGATGAGELLPPQATKKVSARSASSRTILLRTDITFPLGKSALERVTVNSEVSIGIHLP